MLAQGVSFRHAVELLRDGMPTTSSSSAGAPKRSTVRTFLTPVQQDARTHLESTDSVPGRLKLAAESLKSMAKTFVSASSVGGRDAASPRRVTDGSAGARFSAPGLDRPCGAAFTG